MKAAPRRHAYSSDQTDKLWAILESLIPAPAEDAPPINQREQEKCLLKARNGEMKRALEREEGVHAL